MDTTQNTNAMTLAPRQYMVFHLYWEAFGDKLYLTGFEPVAIVTVGTAELADHGGLGLEAVFALTNTMDTPWVQNPQVKPAYPAGCRSTSVGDVVLDMESGKLYECKSMGWEVITIGLRQWLEANARTPEAVHNHLLGKAAELLTSGEGPAA